MAKKILFAGSEALPYIATGGLADVMGALPVAIKENKESYDVRVVLPLYSAISEKWRSQMTFVDAINVELSWRNQYCGIFTLIANGVKYYFIDNEFYFKRDKLYGYGDDIERFAFFSYAIIELMKHEDFYPDVFCANDWQTALSVVKIKVTHAKDEKFKNIKTIYTIHNVDYQGWLGKDAYADVLGLGEYEYYALLFNDCINLTKGALVTTDRINTVSPNYANELQYEFFSHDMCSVIKSNINKMSGIINGIDVNIYNPEKDNDIPYNFNSDDLSGKEKDKIALQKEFGLEVDPKIPVVAMVSRLASHKGFDLVKTICPEFISRNMQFVLLGTGEEELEQFFSEFGNSNKGKVGVKIEFNRAVSKLIYSGADIFLMPSKSEPCGLAQMISSRYGTVPIVREIGGLYDSIKPYDNGKGNGFTFTNYNAHDMLYVIDEAIALFSDKEKWNSLVRKVMNVDFSWDKSAKAYIELFESI